MIELMRIIDQLRRFAHNDSPTRLGRYDQLRETVYSSPEGPYMPGTGMSFSRR